MERVQGLFLDNPWTPSLHLRMDLLPRSLRDSHRRSDRYVGYRVLCHQRQRPRNTHHAHLFHHKLPAPCGCPEGDGMEIHGQDGVCHRHAVDTPGRGTGHHNRRKRQDDTPAGRPGLHVAGARMRNDRHIARHSVPTQRLDRRYRHHCRSDKQVSQHVAGHHTDIRRPAHHRQLVPRVHLSEGLSHNRSHLQDSVRTMHDGHRELHARLCDELAARVGAVYDILAQAHGDSQCHRNADEPRRNHTRRTRMVHRAGDESALHTGQEERKPVYVPPYQDDRP